MSISVFVYFQDTVLMYEQPDGDFTIIEGNVNDGETEIQAAQRLVQEVAGINSCEPTLAGSFCGSNVYAVNTYLASGHDWTQLRVHPRLPSGTKLIAALCLAGLTSWEIQQTVYGYEIVF